MTTSSTQQDWESQIKKYIKDQPISDFLFEVVPGIQYQPFASYANTTERSQTLIGIEKCKIGVQFTSTATNKDIITALENGAESIEVDIDTNTNLETLFNGVRLDYIIPSFNILSEKAASNLESYLKGNYSDELIKSLIINGNGFNINRSTNSYELLRSTYNGPIDELVGLCEKVKTVNGKPFAVHLNISQQFFFEIARIRSLKILIANLLRDAGQPNTNYKIIIKINPSVYSGDENNAMIHQTCAALSGIIGGANILQLQPWDHEKKSYSRLSIHVQNILKLESNIHRYQDVMGGSYFIEDLTDKVAEAVWSKLS